MRENNFPAYMQHLIQDWPKCDHLNVPAVKSKTCLACKRERDDKRRIGRPPKRVTFSGNYKK